MNKWILNATSLLAATMMFSMANAQAEEETLRSNGTDWLDFRSAVIRTAVRIDLNLDQGPTAAPKTFTYRLKDSNFSSVKDWVSKNFATKLNMSPTKPSYKAQAYGNWLDLYASEQGGQDNLLLKIPLNSTTL